MNFLHQSLTSQPVSWGLGATIYLHLTTKYGVDLVRIGGESFFFQTHKKKKGEKKSLKFSSKCCKFGKVN
jgi:hypothetical protein